MIVTSSQRRRRRHLRPAALCISAQVLLVRVCTGETTGPLAVPDSLPGRFLVVVVCIRGGRPIPVGGWSNLLVVVVVVVVGCGLCLQVTKERWWHLVGLGCRTGHVPVLVTVVWLLLLLLLLCRLGGTD